MTDRASITELSIDNPAYANALVTVYDADADGEKTDTETTLYEALTGSSTLANPQRLDSRGKWKQPVYVENACICEIDTGSNSTSHDTGVVAANLAGDAVEDAQAAASQAAGYLLEIQKLVARAIATARAIAANAVPTLTGAGVALNMIRADAAGTAYEFRTPTQVRGDISAVGLTDQNTWTKAQGNAETALVDGATVNWDMDTAPVASITLGGNRTLALSNMRAGFTYSLRVIQDATGSRTMTWDAAIEWGTAGVPTLTTTASKADLVTLYCVSATCIYASIVKGFNAT